MLKDKTDELTIAVRENTQLLQELKISINTLSNRVVSLSNKIENLTESVVSIEPVIDRVGTRLAERLAGSEIAEFVMAAQKKLARIEERLEMEDDAGEDKDDEAQETS